MTEPVRVAMLVQQLLAKVPGGTGRYTSELGRALAANAAEGDSVTGWVSRHSAVELAAARLAGVDGPRGLRLPRPLLSELWARTAVPGTGPRGADVVFAPTPFAPPRGRQPLVVAVHDAVPWTAPETMSARGRSWHRRIITRRVQDADAIVVPTRAVADALTHHLPALRADRLHVTGEGVSAAATTVPADGEARARQLSLPQRYLLMVGTHEPRKGLDVALRALADDRTGDLPLLLVGQPGWGGVDVVGEAAAYGLAPDRVRLLGRIDDADLATAYSRADAVLVPSRDEGFGMPAVEALAHGVPVILSSAPALVEVTGGVGVVTPIGDRRALAAAIADIASWDPARRAEYAARARSQAARHSWSRTARACWEVFRAVG